MEKKLTPREKYASKRLGANPTQRLTEYSRTKDKYNPYTSVDVSKKRKVKISGSKPMGGNTFKTFTKEVPEGSREHKQYLKKKSNKNRTGYNIGGRANLLEEMGRIDARKHPDAADRAEKRRVIGELNRGYSSGGAVLKGKKVGCQIK